MEQYQAQSEALRNGLEKMEKMLETAGKACDVIGSILTSAEARRESLGTSADQTPPSVKAEPAPEQVSKDEPGGEDVVASVFDGVKDDAAEDKDAWDSKEETAQAGQPESAGSDQVFYVTRVDDAEENSGDTAEKEPEPEKETIAEVKSEPEPKPVESAAENVAPGESVTLDSYGIDTSNLTYEEALALVLSKNGIKYRSTGFQTASDDNEKTKEFKTNMASVEQIKPGKSAKKDEAGAAEKKQKKEKKPGLVSLIKQGINAILEDEDDEDDDDDSLDPSIFDEIKASEQPLQFGKDYDVKKKN